MMGATKHRPRIAIRDQALGLPICGPSAGGDSLGALRRGPRASRLHEEKVTYLVDQIAAEAEVPFDGANQSAYREVLHPGFLPDLAIRGLVGSIEWHFRFRGELI